MKILDEGIKKISEKSSLFSNTKQCCTLKSKREIRTYTEELKNDIGEQIQKIQTAIYSTHEREKQWWKDKLLSFWRIYNFDEQGG